LEDDASCPWTPQTAPPGADSAAPLLRGRAIDQARAQRPKLRPAGLAQRRPRCRRDETVALRTDRAHRPGEYLNARGVVEVRVAGEARVGPKHIVRGVVLGIAKPERTEEEGVRIDTLGALVEVQRVAVEDTIAGGALRDCAVERAREQVDGAVDEREARYARVPGRSGRARRALRPGRSQGPRREVSLDAAQAAQRLACIVDLPPPALPSPGWATAGRRRPGRRPAREPCVSNRDFAPRPPFSGEARVILASDRTDGYTTSRKK